MPAARRFPELGLRVSRDLDLIEPVANLTRIPRAEGAEEDPSDEAGSETP
jgi:hypothetical protein